MKKIIFLSLLCLLVIFGVFHYSHSQLKPYYSGDAINFQGTLYVGTTNTKSLEIFKLIGQELKRLVNIRPYDARFGTYGNFYDMKFVEESGHLYVYTVSEFTLYKYELFSDGSLNLVFNQKNTYWEWYNRVDKFGDNFVTGSAKGIKFWNADMQVINNYILPEFENPYNPRSYDKKNILNIQGNYFTVYNMDTRKEIVKIPVNYKKLGDNHLSYQDENNNLYIVDDYYAKKYNFDGQLLGSFKHLDYSGYDITSSGFNNYLYFSNGIGVVKLNKDTMESVSDKFTDTLGGPQGWAMGLRVVNLNGDKVVVFNSSNILVLNDKLEKIASFRATELADETSKENLALSLNHYLGAPSAIITMNGAGYFPNEDLSIDFAGTKSVAKADYRGRFSVNLVVPELKRTNTTVTPATVDIKVVGVASKLNYSTSFKIQ